MLSTQEDLCQRAEGVAVTVGELLGLRGGERWADLRENFAAITRQFFQDATSYGAFVTAESCRDLLREQNRGLKRLSLGSPVYSKLPNRGRRRREVRFATVALPSREVEFAARDGAERTSRLAWYEHMRIVQSGTESFRGTFATWCRADPGADANDLANFRVPAGMTCELAPGINGGKLVNWIKMRGLSGWVDIFALEIHPASGELLSIRTTLVPLRLLLEMHPRWHGWFQQALD